MTWGNGTGSARLVYLSPVERLKFVCQQKWPFLLAGKHLGFQADVTVRLANDRVVSIFRRGNEIVEAEKPER